MGHLDPCPYLVQIYIQLICTYRGSTRKLKVSRQLKSIRWIRGSVYWFELFSFQELITDHQHLLCFPTKMVSYHLILFQNME